MDDATIDRRGSFPVMGTPSRAGRSIGEELRLETVELTRAARALADATMQILRRDMAAVGLLEPVGV